MAVSTDQAIGDRDSATSDDFKRCAELLALSPAASLVVDAAGLVRLANAAAADLLRASPPRRPGLSPVDPGADPVGRAFTDFVEKGSADSARRLIAQLRGGGAIPADTRLDLVRADGSLCHAGIVASTVPWGAQRAILIVLTEIGVPGRVFLPAVPGTRPELAAQDPALMQALDAMSEGFALFDAERRLLLFNENYRTLIWPLLADFIKVGVRFEDIALETIRRNVWKESGVDTERLLEQALERHDAAPSIHELHYPDGRVIRQSKQPTADGGVIAIYADISDLKRREARARQNEERHRRLLDTLPDGVAIHSGGKFAYANPAIVRLFGGRSHTDLIGRNSVDFLPPEDRDRALRRMQRALTERTALPPVEQRRIRLDGRIIHVEARLAYIVWNDKPAVLTVLRDLSERQRAEHAVRETERRYSAVAENLPGAVYQRVMYPDGTISFPYVSRGVMETHGHAAEAVMRDSRLLVDAIHPDDRDRYRRQLQESSRDLTAFDTEIRNVRPDGRVVWIRTVARPHRRDDGATVWDGLFVDVTGRKVAEEQAAQTFRWLVEAIDSLSDGFALWDPEDRLVLWNDKFLSGHPQRDRLCREGTRFAEVVEHTAANMAELWSRDEARAYAAERLRWHSETRGSHELRTAIGIWFLLTERRTQEGYTVSIYTDITEQHRAADALAASEDRYRRLVQMSPDAVLVQSDGVIEFANETAVKMFGAADTHDLVGRHILDLVHEDDRLRAARHNEKGSPATGETLRIRHQRFDGAVRHSESTISRISWNGREAYLVVIRDIEDNISAQRQRALLETVIEQAESAIEIGDRELVCHYVNPSFESMTGLSRDDVIGKVSDTLLRPPGLTEAEIRDLERTVRGGTPWSGIVHSAPRNGLADHYEVLISPVFDEAGAVTHFLSSSRNITQRVRTEEALRESEESYRKLLEITPDAIYVHVDGEIVVVNKASVDVFGARDEGDLIGRNVLDLIHPDFHAQFEANQKRVRIGDDRPMTVEQKRLRLDGTEFWCNTSITPLQWKGRRAAQVIVRDATEQRRAREELVRALESAEVANRSKSDFLANMSHELRTPLNAIIGFSEIMRNEMFGSIGHESYGVYARDIHDSGMHLLHVINDILDLSKIEAGKLTPHYAEIDLREAVEGSVRLIDLSATTAGVGIDVRIPDGLPLISADSRMIKQILVNLLSNAVKFTPRGGWVRVRVRQDNRDSVEISVTDTGIGILRTDIERVMEPFGQGGDVAGNVPQGTGLGLPLTRSLVELHGGTFRLRSRVGLGTRATARLPVGRRDRAPVDQAR